MNHVVATQTGAHGGGGNEWFGRPSETDLGES